MKNGKMCSKTILLMLEVHLCQKWLNVLIDQTLLQIEPQNFPFSSVIIDLNKNIYESYLMPFYDQYYFSFCIEEEL
jgi:hypothetical protein